MSWDPPLKSQHLFTQQQPHVSPPCVLAGPDGQSVCLLGSPGFSCGSIRGRDGGLPQVDSGLSLRAVLHPQRGSAVFMLGRHHSRKASPAAQTFCPALACLQVTRVPAAKASHTVPKGAREAVLIGAVIKSLSFHAK